MIILCNILLPNDKPQGIPAELGNSSELKPVNDRVTNVVVEEILSTLSTVSKIQATV